MARGVDGECARRAIIVGAMSAWSDPATLDNPFGTRLSPMSRVRSVTYVSGPDMQFYGSERGTRTPDPRIMIPVL